ncbi:hypothetical protein LXM88_32660 [Burkholderia sp. S-53]|nr:hypothetical protein [Burkholderia sp. S-53]UXU90072.1 hypothetical protein LXM88_32660 [Burkholderia sp. S-53]
MVPDEPHTADREIRPLAINACQGRTWAARPRMWVELLPHVSSSEYCERQRPPLYQEYESLSGEAAARDRHRARCARSSRRAGLPAARTEPVSAGRAARPARSMQFARAMLERGVILAPGAVFSPQADRTSAYCRFNVAYLADKRFAQALQAIA